MNNSKTKLTKPRIPTGFMELLPEKQVAFNDILDKIRSSYELFGFMPIDTPSMEYSEILMAKSGGETEKQIYEISKGDDKYCLRFDLTVPLARYVAQNINSLTFPFKRYQIGKVYRGEKPQKGRFREFYQADIDIIDRDKLDLINDAEILAVINQVFSTLNLSDFIIKISNRKILSGLLEEFKAKNKNKILRTIDKLPKIGQEEMSRLLTNLDLSQKEIDIILTIAKLRGKIEVLEKISDFSSNKVFQTGIDELRKVINYLNKYNLPKENYEIDLSITRGLDYYTGTVYETFLNKYPQLGSVCSGGRYDNLFQFYTDNKLPGVGMSIGVTRLFSVIQDSIEDKQGLIKAIVIPMEGYLPNGINIANQLRKNKINTILYGQKEKMGKILSFASKNKISFALILGENEVKQDLITVKNLQTGEQKLLNINQTIEWTNK
jgi:histidyl-tRNA synthetase